ncbi:hypothetical protein Nepgr_021446 [Nepenthes gracilis]|uniref:Uncharacterized protein n=1 Tax=Nepenthes gracilis TaxID=150966 RepID=A0AAD3XX81_NEPGR|nr:hypothetical protein Nepgr_021446 [Nepenthes gracilis]
MCRDINGGGATEKTERYCLAMKVVARVTLLWIKMSSNRHANGRGAAVERCRDVLGCEVRKEPRCNFLRYQLLTEIFVMCRDVKG